MIDCEDFHFSSYLLVFYVMLHLYGCVFPWVVEAFFYNLVEDLVYDLGFSLSSMHVIGRFCLFMVSYIFCTFLSFVFFVYFI